MKDRKTDGMATYEINIGIAKKPVAKDMSR